MTRVTTHINMTMQRQTDSIVVGKSLGASLLLVFGFRGLVSGTVDVASLYAAEIVTASGHSLMKSDSYRGSGTEGLATIAARNPSLSRRKNPIVRRSQRNLGD